MPSAAAVLRPSIQVFEPEWQTLASGTGGAIVGAMVGALLWSMQVRTPVGFYQDFFLQAFVFDALVGGITGAWTVIFAGRRGVPLTMIAGIAAVLAIFLGDVLVLSSGRSQFRPGPYLDFFVKQGGWRYPVAILVASGVAVAIAWDGWGRLFGRFEASTPG